MAKARSASALRRSGSTRRGLALLLLLPLLTAALAGCTVANDLQRFLDRAQGRVQYVDVERLNEEVPFAPTDAPAPPPRQGHLTVLNFTVPAGARSLRLEVTVTFADTLPLPVPAGIPHGQVIASLVSPDREEGNATFLEDGVESFSVEGPAVGEWGLELETFGQGVAFVLASTNEPAR